MGNGLLKRHRGTPMFLPFDRRNERAVEWFKATKIQGLSAGFTGMAADGFEHIAIQSLSRAQRYNVLTGAIIPRPIAFVTSVGAGGVVNAAPFSQFVILAVDPGLLVFSVGPRTRNSAAKDTLANVSETGEFVINMVPEGWEGIVQQASVEYPPDVSEVDLFGLKTIASTKIKVPRLEDCKIQFECILEQIINLAMLQIISSSAELSRCTSGAASCMVIRSTQPRTHQSRELAGAITCDWAI